jgi:hypothetical protein
LRSAVEGGDSSRTLMMTRSKATDSTALPQPSRQGGAREITHVPFRSYAELRGGTWREKPHVLWPATYDVDAHFMAIDLRLP